jgi:hypothetical protein
MSNLNKSRSEFSKAIKSIGVFFDGLSILNCLSAFIFSGINRNKNMVANAIVTIIT